MQEKEMIVVGDSKYPLIKKGRAQAEQVEDILQWLGRHGGKLVEEFTNEEGEIEISENIAEMLMDISRVLTADALIELYIVITGCTEEEAEDYFDIAQLIDISIEVFEKQKSFRKVVNRFFSKSEPIEATEEHSTK